MIKKGRKLTVTAGCKATISAAIKVKLKKKSNCPPQVNVLEFFEILGEPIQVFQLVVTEMNCCQTSTPTQALNPLDHIGCLKDEI